ncbi:manganese efflux pump MntP family protein [Anaerosphaera multitolerans]|uniref:Putative manganese efflux pump MntP n=1 Tax=Anaerosphaera multitolerans TaxID=2487351 RepID=A0A437S859_9FIRM|nr:manganese efflux pump MntP family protein [Anaerosphaera multitolerans]RVU55108.1 manganese efflux pump [Anaerosphaera multitolerans]
MENLLSVSLIGLGLSMDAFAASVCKGLSLQRRDFKKSVKAGTYFGLFQGLMPVIGFLLANNFANEIKDIDHWVAFILLGVIGLNMIKESFDKDCPIDCDFNFKSMVTIAIATSIDALAIGVTFAFLNVKIIQSSLLIGIITFFISILGVELGNIFGIRYKQKAEFAGGIILILMGTKILFEHLNLLPL